MRFNMIIDYILTRIPGDRKPKKLQNPASCGIAAQAGVFTEASLVIAEGVEFHRGESQVEGPDISPNAVLLRVLYQIGRSDS